MKTMIKQEFTFNEAKSIFNLLSNTISMMVFFDSGSHDTHNKIGVVAHDINAIQASMFLAAIDTECVVTIVSVSDGFEFTLAMNAAMNKTSEPTKDVEYTDDEENQMYGMAYEAMINER